jgi:small subunit ribosomal protein S16
VVKIRLKRFGRKNHAFWRLNAVDHRSPRDGKIIEELGYYDPTNKDKAKQVVVNKARIEFWLKAGAQPSETVKQMLPRAVDAGAAAMAVPAEAAKA